jgi:predicted acylesterase/phospholipase RssA
MGGASLPTAADPTQQLTVTSGAPGRDHLQSDQITHIALEGGGGKGLAFLGAIKALQDLKVIAFVPDPQVTQRLVAGPNGSQIVGLSGSSAGAITAMLLGSGMDYSDIKSWMSTPESAGAPMGGSTATGSSRGPSPGSGGSTSPGSSASTTPGAGTSTSASGGPTTGQGGSNAPAAAGSTTPSAGGVSSPGGAGSPSPSTSPAAPTPSAGNANFGCFFDPAIPRTDWCGNPIQGPTRAENRLERALTYGPQTAVAAWLLPMFGLPGSLVDLLPAAGPSWLPTLLKAIYLYKAGNPPTIFNALIQDLEKRLSWLGRDRGLFSGVFAYQTFNTLLSSRMGFGSSQSQVITLNQFSQAYKVDLAITGSNLTTGKTVWFRSGETSTNGNTAVAAAVRASMSLPFVFKPVLLPGANPKVPDVYVDGGVWNNTPYTAFDTNLAAPTTLVLRLGIDERASPDTLGSFLGRYAELTFAGSGETQFDEARDFQAVVLAAKGLSTFDFVPDPTAEQLAVNDAYRTTYAYFHAGEPDKTMLPFPPSQ